MTDERRWHGHPAAAAARDFGRQILAHFCGELSAEDFGGDRRPAERVRAPLVTEIDITWPSRTLYWQRRANAALVTVATGWALVFLGLSIAEDVDPITRAAALALFVILAAAAVSGWLSVPSIDPRSWRAYPWMLLLAAGSLALGALVPNPDEGFTTSSRQHFFVLNLIGSVVLGGTCRLLFESSAVPALGSTLAALLGTIRSHADGARQPLGRIPRVSVSRALVSIIAALLVLVAVPGSASMYWNMGHDAFVVISVACFPVGAVLCMRALRLMQVDADALLALDRRAPVLLLRSFSDDDKHTYTRSGLMSFPLEMRLANHFHCFGPFIAVGTPGESVPELGAARVMLREDVWQARIIEWIERAQTIVMYCGTTPWVNWELQRIVAAGRTSQLLLLFPDITHRRGRLRRRRLGRWGDDSWEELRRRDIEARVVELRACFRGTRWAQPLSDWIDFDGVRAVVFRADGSLSIVSSRSRSADAYHLAALIAHLLIIGDGARGATAVPTRAAPKRWAWRAAPVLLGSIVLALLAVLAMQPAAPAYEPLLFGRSSLYYQSPVTRAEAQNTGRVLQDIGYFTSEHEVTVMLERRVDVVVMRFVIEPASRSEALELSFAELGLHLSELAFDGAPVDVVLCSPTLETLTKLPRMAMLAAGATAVYYSATVAEADALAIRQELLRWELYGTERGGKVILTRERGAHHVRFVIEEATVDDEHLPEPFAAAARVISSRALGGQGLVIHLCDDALVCSRGERM